MEKWFYKTYLGFDLNVAPLVVKSIIDAAPSHEDLFGRVTSANVYVYVNESIISAEQVRAKMAD